MLAEDELTEILVGGDEDRDFAHRTPEHLLVRSRRHVFGDIADFMAILPQLLDDLALDALIAEELQAASSGIG